MDQYNVIIQQSESTVVAEYKSDLLRQKEYQSETELEAELIKQLRNQGYVFLPIHNNQELISNLRVQLERLNAVAFSDKEWDELLSKYIDNQNDSIANKTFNIQENHQYTLRRENGELINVRLLDKKQIHNNQLQVIHQYEVEGNHQNRYDVTILVNGLPLVHVELKRRGVAIKEAFNQIQRYERDSFWADNGLFQYVQIFVISNGTETKYYSNTTRELATKENTNSNTNKKKTSNSFEFTSYWADANNRNIKELHDFTATFLSKHTILNVLTKYCIFTSDEMLLVMRPYQIAATEKIINQIFIAYNAKNAGTINAGGYVWHTTGSGKTLTSFKTARIASELDYIKKVIFVVDRKDLDYQTMKEYDKFEKGSANSNTNTAVLKKQLEDPNATIIITTIQKLSIFIKKNPKHDIYLEHVVLIFDECHRSQFGDMHKEIIKSFKKYYIFGFTGTPIFAINTTQHNKFPTLKTTEQVFGKKLHTYTVVNAIHDQNVLPFRIDYLNTAQAKDDIDDSEEVYNIKKEEALLDTKRIAKNVEYVLEHFAQKTKRNEKAYDFTRLMNIEDVAKSSYLMRAFQAKEFKQSLKITGFNAIFACASIEAAKRYYAEFKKQQESVIPVNKLKIALIYSWSANEELDGFEDENNENTDRLDKSSRDFLDAAIKDYNLMFGTSYDTSSDKFQNYYKDLSLRVKNKEIDLMIVVNMFLTGFDATTLNTLWVDKKLRMHGLIQAFSRTNRILNSIKTFGNIVCFRNLENSVNQAISVFGDKDAGGIVLLKSFKEYYEGYEGFKGYKNLVNELQAKYPIGLEIVGEKLKKEFIFLFNQIMKAKNILQSFDDFQGKQILSDFDFQDYQSIYLGLYDEFRKTAKADAELINDEIVFEIELVKSVEVNIDYILMLVEKYHKDHNEDKEIEIRKAIDSSPSLRNKKDLIINFIKSLTVDQSVADEWKRYIDQKKQEELDKIIREENLNRDETYKYIEDSFENGEVKETGTAIVKVLPPTSMFGNTDGVDRSVKKMNVLQKLMDFFNRFFGL
ncbi:MAG: type I restriction endonuclease subunit R [Patescibacteria group bacterium]